MHQYNNTVKHFLICIPCCVTQSQSLSHLGDAPKAIKDLNQALQQQPSAPCIHLHLASNYAKLHQLEKVYRHAAKAFTHYTDDTL